jgi:hypothetical protein
MSTFSTLWITANNKCFVQHVFVDGIQPGAGLECVTAVINQELDWNASQQ